MKAGRFRQSRQSWLIAVICLICAILIKPVQDRFESRRAGQEPEPDLLFFSSPAAVKRIALGYDNLLADFYWMRAIQYYGRREEASKRPVRYKNLSTLLDITTTLDPNLTDAYRAGSNFLAEPDPVGAGQPREALKLLDKGICAHPQDWQLHYDKGFIYYWFLQDYRAAGEAWLAASKLSSAPYWMAGLAAVSLSKGGAFEIALSLWQRQYQESDRKDIRENARNHLLSFQVAKDLWTLELLLKKFRAATGSFPHSLQELLHGQNRKYEIVDPSGVPYEYDPQTGNVGRSSESKVKYLSVPQFYKQQLQMAMTNDE
jgi:tetratricopeptide (TPR) repeat protein